VLGRAVPLGRHDHAGGGVERVGALDEVDVGLLAGLEDAELRVDRALRGHHPVRERLGASAEGFDAEPGRPAPAVLEVVIGAEFEDEPVVDVAQVVRRRDVAVRVGAEAVRKCRVLGVLREIVVRHRWRCSMS
jgi:hypothetical protein